MTFVLPLSLCPPPSLVFHACVRARAHTHTHTHTHTRPVLMVGFYRLLSVSVAGASPTSLNVFHNIPSPRPLSEYMEPYLLWKVPPSHVPQSHPSGLACDPRLAPLPAISSKTVNSVRSHRLRTNPLGLIPLQLNEEGALQACLLHFPPLGSWAHPSQASGLWAALLLQGVGVGFYQQNPDIHRNLVSLVLCPGPPGAPEILPTGPAGLFPWDFSGSLGGLEVLLAGRRVGGCRTSQPIRSVSRAGLPPAGEGSSGRVGTCAAPMARWKLVICRLHILPH